MQNTNEISGLMSKIMLEHKSIQNILTIIEKSSKSLIQITDLFKKNMNIINRNLSEISNENEKPNRSTDFQNQSITTNIENKPSENNISNHFNFDASIEQKQKEIQEQRTREVLEYYDFKTRLSQKQISDDLQREQEQEKLNRERIEKRKKEQKEVLEFTGSISSMFANIATNALEDSEKARKKVFKSMLSTFLEAVEKQLRLSIIGVSAQNIFTGGLSSPKLIGLSALQASLSLLKSRIASFDIGGIPTMPGMGMLHPGDVIVNPTSENPMMERLTDSLASKINGRQQNVSLQIDGRELGRATINAMNRENETIPVGRRGL